MNRFKLTDIRLAWDRVGQPIADLQSRYKFDWRSEDVYARCLTGQSFCWLCEDGFVIVTPQENPFTLRKELFVWICIGWSGEDLINEYYDDICTIAKDIAASAIVFESPREGFLRMAKTNHWGVMSRYELKVA